MATSSDDFTTTCLDYLKTYSSQLNYWFDPIDPITSISQQEICDLHSTLFSALRAEGIYSLAEYTAFSYLTGLDLYLNANQQIDYEDCINTNVVSNPGTYCDSFVTQSSVMYAWDSVDKLDTCDTVEYYVELACYSSSCDGCSILLSEVYKTYEYTLN